MSEAIRTFSSPYLAPAVAVGAGVGLVYFPVATLGVMSIGILIALIPRVDHLALVAVVITTATYRGIYFAGRTEIFDFPVSFFDVLWLIVVLYALPVGLSRGRDRLQIPMLLLLASAVVTVVVGLLFDQDFYSIVKFFRAEVFIFVGYLAARALGPENARRGLQAIVIGSAITGLAQVVTFVFARRGVNVWSLIGVSAFDVSDVHFGVNPRNVDLFRDLGVTVNFAMVAALILAAAAVARDRIFPLPVSLGLFTICVAGVILSLTRTVWIGLLIGLVILVIASGIMNARLLALGSMLVIAMFALVIAGRTFDISTEVTVQERFRTLEDPRNVESLQTRMSETDAALAELGGRWWSGVGAAPVDLIEEGSWIQRNQLHNGYIHYFVAGGIVALGCLLGILAIASISAWRMGRRGLDASERFVGLACVSSLVSLAVVTLVGGVVNDAYQTPILGMLLGMATVSLAGHEEPQP